MDKDQSRCWGLKGPHNANQQCRPVVQSHPSITCQSVPVRQPFAVWWTVSNHPNYGPKVYLEPSIFGTAIKRSNHAATPQSNENLSHDNTDSYINHRKQSEIACYVYMQGSEVGSDFSSQFSLIINLSQLKSYLLLHFRTSTCEKWWQLEL